MRPRERTILLGALGLLVLGGIAFFAQETHAEELAPPGEPTAPVAAPAPAPPPGDDGSDAPVATGDVLAAPTTVERDRGPAVDTTGWTKGLIQGDIQLAVSVLDRIESIHVIVEEARNFTGTGSTFQRPTKLVVPVTRGRGTPTFEVRDVPFSAYPYVVSVHAPGLNGSRITIAIDEKNPCVNDVVLRITPAAPFSVLVRDQDNLEFRGIDVRLLPVGEPAGRKPHQGTTDNFGSVVFDEVLAGDYQVFANHNGQALMAPQTITVQPGMPAARSKVLGQSHALTIPRGLPVRLYVHDRFNYGIADAVITATMTDRVRLTTREVTTDHGGNAEFSHLQPGVWQFRVTKDKHQLWDRQFTLKQGQDPLQLDVQLVPMR